MSILFIYMAIALGLFVAAYITRRRYGLLGLALAAGHLLSTIWGSDVVSLVGGFGVSTGALTSAIVHSAIVVLPPVVLMFHGYAYKLLPARVIGAALFALVAMAFLVEPLGRALTPVGSGLEVYEWLVENRWPVIALGMGLAVLDLFMTKPAEFIPDKKRKR